MSLLIRQSKSANVLFSLMASSVALPVPFFQSVVLKSEGEISFMKFMQNAPGYRMVIDL